MTPEDKAEIIRHFDVVAESLRSDISKVAEGVLAANERLDRFSAEVRTEFGEAKAMMKFSFVDLDRRVTLLEQAVQSMEQRLNLLASKSL